MEQIRRLASPGTMQNEIGSSVALETPEGRPPNKVIALSSAIENASIERIASDGAPLAGKWPGLLERVRGAAEYIREVEDRAQEQEQRVQDLLEQVRADMQEASAKLLAAEQRTRDVQLRANELIKAAEERAGLAEKRAAVAEAWLIQISQTIETEFVVEPTVSKKTGTLGN